MNLGTRRKIHVRMTSGLDRGWYILRDEDLRRLLWVLQLPSWLPIRTFIRFDGRGFELLRRSQIESVYVDPEVVE